MRSFFRGSSPDGDADQASPVVPIPPKRPLPKEEQRLMFESGIHWGRGLAIVLGMAGIVVIFLIVLTVLPKPGSGNPLDSITGLNNSSSSVSSVGAADRSPTPATVLSTVVPTPSARLGGGATSTPGPRWVAAAPRGANVRPAPSTNNNPVGVLTPGQQVPVIGRSADNAWYQIIWGTNQKAWVAQDLLPLQSGDPTQLPVVSGQ